MSDIELSREQWAMARQAGAAFTDEDPDAVQTPYGQQQVIPGVGPLIGTTYRNRHTGMIATLVALRDGRFQWAKLRYAGHYTEVPVGWLDEHWQACKPDGTLL